MADVEPPTGANPAPPHPRPADPGPALMGDPLINVRDRLFHSLFHRFTLAYARGCPKPIRRIIETIVLLKAIVCFLALVYIHVSFSRTPTKCLDDLKDTWPRDGILRVEIYRDMPPGYNLEQSYERERRMHMRNQHQQDELSMILAAFTSEGILDDFFGNREAEEEDTEEMRGTQTEDEGQLNGNSAIFGSYEEMIGNGSTRNGSAQGDFHEGRGSRDSSYDSLHGVSLEQPAPQNNLTDPDSTVEPIAPMLEENGDEILIQRDDDSHKEDSSEQPPNSQPKNKAPTAWRDEDSVVEYSLEYGFLRLSPSTRQKLNITVELVVLDPATNSCFGDAFSQVILQGLLGYDDLLMSSIKSLVENDNNKGYLRNVVSGAQYHFVSRWPSAFCYLISTLVMVIFTLSISMLLRYSQHQIFMFILEVLHMLEFNTNITFPAAPLLTVILALVGMEAIMSEFFEDTTTAFYIILIVWMADQYDSICCHTSITRRFWLRFFYLYQLSFYAFHYRFSGQNSGLALITMWLFTQHSMIYFFHHYELPVILQQAQVQEMIIRNQQQGRGNGQQATLRITTGVVPRGGVLALNNGAVIRPHMRGFSFAGFRFRFGVVFHNNNNNIAHQPNLAPAQEQQLAPTAADTTGEDPATADGAANPTGPAEEARSGLDSTLDSVINDSIPTTSDHPPPESDTTPRGEELATGGKAPSAPDQAGDRCEEATRELIEELDESQHLVRELEERSSELRSMMSELGDVSRTLKDMRERSLPEGQPNAETIVPESENLISPGPESERDEDQTNGQAVNLENPGAASPSE
eukprot:maker-scaffold367_size194084-snap-gene-0.45 protein:Tk00505 transcript:maker-scaffold367_size194084-snap-gene-0.45-mRNA-1 annotation:"low quality protein: membralin"